MGDLAQLVRERQEPDARLRAQMLRYLGAHMDSFPQNRALMQDQLPRERDRGVLLAILNSLLLPPGR